eukprot:9341344-Alexandrium_andersonii.AAC.1
MSRVPKPPVLGEHSNGWGPVGDRTLRRPLEEGSRDWSEEEQNTMSMLRFVSGESSASALVSDSPKW